MPVIIAAFDNPEDITGPRFRGKVFRFPVTVIDRDDMGTPRQTSKAISFQIRTEISRSRLTTWGLGKGDLIKVMFEITKEHLISALSSGKWNGEDIEVQINTHTHKGACPFNPSFIQEPTGAILEIEIKRHIGFVV
ncbi:MAG: hypothetical protein SRB2_03685 [Desulfobacteraceae bacterium Eth-SRB2]|nr:MAG: hypothetical protein SRB2_03685 [Desulfobacteraceae bacterium Eth-SRB2]